MALTRKQLLELAQEAGFNDQAATAAAIAMAESSGNPDAVNSVPCYGLWQINMSGTMGPDRRKKLGLTSDKQLLDPKTNARAAKLVYDEQGWQGWTTYTSGKYKEFSFDATGPITTPVPGTVGGELATIGESGIGEGSPIDKLTDVLRQSVLTTIVFVLALVITIAGMVILARKPIGAGVNLATGGSVKSVARKGIKSVIK